jgi:hypothetical protein
MNGSGRMDGGYRLPRLNRSNLRDFILLCSVLSSLVFSLTTIEMALGLVILGAGCLLHLVTKGQLVRNVVLCRTGLYGMVRHPYYLANYVIDSAICLLSGNIYLVAVYPFFFFWAYGPTFQKEEAYLASQHEDHFREHAAGTPQIFPHGGSIPGRKGLLEGFSMKRISVKECARLARFWASALFIVFVHEVRTEGLNKLRGWHDPIALLLFGLVIVLSGISLLLTARRKSPNQDGLPGPRS